MHIIDCPVFGERLSQWAENEMMRCTEYIQGQPRDEFEELIICHISVGFLYMLCMLRKDI